MPYIFGAGSTSRDAGRYPIDRECRDKLRKLLLDWLEERRGLGLEESLAYKFQDVLEMSLALFIL